MKRYFRDCAWTVRIPRRLQEIQGTVAAKLPLLEQELGHEPSIDDLAEHLGLDAAEVEQAMAARGCFNTLSLDRPMTQVSRVLRQIIEDLRKRLGPLPAAA